MPRLVTNLWLDTEGLEADPDPDRVERAFEAMFPMSKIDIAAIRAAADG